MKNCYKSVFSSIYTLSMLIYCATPSYASGVDDAKWCAGPGATKMIKDQPMGPPSVCTKYLGLGLKTQNQLANEARQAAKEGRNDDAIEALKICQCHNPGSRAAIDADRDEVIKWLKQ